MDNFQLSFWIFDKNFVPTVMLCMFWAFAGSYSLTKISNSKTLRDFFTGNTRKGKQKEREEIITAREQHIKSVLQGRKMEELEDWERDYIKELNEYYLEALKEINRR